MTLRSQCPPCSPMYARRDPAGLSGFRVYCGHWSLTDHLDEKVGVLLLLGFRREPDAALVLPRKYVKSAAPYVAALQEELASGVFDYVLVEKDYVLCQYLKPAAQGAVVYDGPEYWAIRLSPSIRERLQNRIRAMQSLPLLRQPG